MNDDRIEGFDHGYRLTRDEVDSLASGSDDEADREAAASMTVLSAPDGVSELICRLTEPEERPTRRRIHAVVWSFDREWAVQTLARAEDDRVVPTLCRLLDTHEYRVKKAAFELLGRLRDPRAIEPLKAALSEPWAAAALAQIASHVESVRADVVAALCERVEALCEAALDPEQGQDFKNPYGYVDFRNLFTPLIKALGSLRSPGSVKSLRRVLALPDVDRHVRDEAARALGPIG